MLVTLRPINDELKDGDSERVFEAEIMTTMGRLTAAGLSLLVSGSALAHEGHGDPQHQTGVLHYLVNPSHAVTILIAAVVLAVGIRAVVKLARRTTVRVPIEQQPPRE